jgi:branched-chain amino acid transport system substrate-binding protein
MPGRSSRQRASHLVRRACLAVVMVTVLVAAACSSDDGSGSGSGEDVDEVDVGFVFSLTGTFAQGVAGSRNAAEMAVEDINEAGGIESLGGAQLVANYGDTASEPQNAATEVSRLVDQEGVVALLDTFPSNITAVASQAAERVSTPFLAAVSYGSVLPERDLNYYFQLQVPASEAGVQDVAFLDKTVDDCGLGNRVVVIHEDTEYGTSFVDAQVPLLEDEGYEVVDVISHTTGAPDFTSQVSRAQAANPDLVLLNTYLQDAILITETMDRLGLDVPVMESGSKIDPRYSSAVGDLGIGEFTRATWVPGLAGSFEEVSARFNEQYDTPFDSIAALVYQGTWVLAAALEDAGSTDRDAIRDALDDLSIGPDSEYLFYDNWDGIEFADNGVNTTERFLGVQYENDAWNIVFPDDVAVAETVCPGS